MGGTWAGGVQISRSLIPEVKAVVTEVTGKDVSKAALSAIVIFVRLR